MTDQEKTKEQLITELAELRQRIALKAAETERKRAEQAILNRRTWLPVASMFVLLGVLVWLDEILSLPRLLGAPHTPINWREAIIETVMFAGLGLFAVLRLIRDMTERKQAEERIEHLNLVLRAIRNVNQLITKERDRDRLLKGACDNLIETRGYHNAWIALFDEAGGPALSGAEGPVTSAEAGWGEDFLPLVEQLKCGEVPDCARRALSQPGVVVTQGPSTCADCPLSVNCGGRGAMTVRLEHEGKVYGLSSVSIPADFIADEEERALFEEIAGDIGFALHSIELEERRKRAEKALQEYSERLEEMVEQRTQELQDAQEQLIRKERLAVLGQLAGGVAHEMRNPLGVISNAIYFLQMTLPDADETTREYLDIVSSEVHGAEKIVSDLLDFSRTKPAEREEIAVSDLVSQVLERRPPPEDVEVVTQIPADLPPVFVDPRQIGQVLGNLVTNAYQAMLDGGRLMISVSEDQGIERRGDKGTRRQGDSPPVSPSPCLRVSISDTGCGIPKENIEKVFEPLFTTKAKGIGLGLAVSKNLVETNGGSIEVESEVGKSSTFTVKLPLARPGTRGKGDGEQ